MGGHIWLSWKGAGGGINNMTRIARATVIVALLAIISVLVPYDQADSSSAPVTNGITWLRSQQQPDGGFETEGYPGFETSDAILALAQSAQSGGAWNYDAARAAVLGTSTATGNTPLNEIDNYASGAIGSGAAGKIISLVTNPLAIDPTTFDPSNNGVVNLVTKLGFPGTGDFGIPLASFNSILFAARGYATLNSVPASTITLIRGAQKSDGSWSYNGDNTGIDGGADTTGLAVQTLIEAGVAAGDSDVSAALDYLVTNQQHSGGWIDGWAENPNSTAVAMLALVAAERTAPLAAGNAYLLSTQQPAGFFAGPYDDATPNTFATAQAIQGLVRAAIPDAPSYVTPKTITAATGGGAITLEASSGTLTTVSAVAPSTQTAPPTGISFPRGLVSFTVTGLSAGATTTVRITLPVGTTATGYYKLVRSTVGSTVGSTWINAISIVTFSNNVATLTLTDGGEGDDDGVRNGVIVDPGGPTVGTANSARESSVELRFTG